MFHPWRARKELKNIPFLLVEGPIIYTEEKEQFKFERSCWTIVLNNNSYGDRDSCYVVPPNGKGETSRACDRASLASLQCNPSQH
ncbi:hypothetical protein LR48_Vigan03g108700 [Vigna angularis]|uniref:Uncharacterized protein n=1 Tax=Phaseolus angularis TaxID=3914 RepID=A0A0L9U4J0_PHAAN|nr:hypothetical protein LR48_Vigan03g108700 [Vigna angularis]